MKSYTMKISALALVVALLLSCVPLSFASEPGRYWFYEEDYQKLRPFPYIFASDANNSTLVLYDWANDRFECIKHSENSVSQNYETQTVYMRNYYDVYRRNGIDGEWYWYSRYDAGTSLDVDGRYVIYTDKAYRPVLEQEGYAPGWYYWGDEGGMSALSEYITVDEMLPLPQWTTNDVYKVLYFDEVDRQYYTITANWALRIKNVNGVANLHGTYSSVSFYTYKWNRILNEWEFQSAKTYYDKKGISLSNKKIIYSVRDVLDDKDKLLYVAGKMYSSESKYTVDINGLDVDSTISLSKTSEKSASQALSAWVYTMHGSEYGNYYYDGESLILGNNMQLIGRDNRGERGYYVLRGNDIKVYKIIGVSGTSIDVRNVSSQIPEGATIGVPEPHIRIPVSGVRPWEAAMVSTGPDVKYYGAVYPDARFVNKSYYIDTLEPYIGATDNPINVEFAPWDDYESLLAVDGDYTKPDIVYPSQPEVGDIPVDPSASPDPDASPVPGGDDDPWKGVNIPGNTNTNDLNGMSGSIDTALDDMTANMDYAISQVDMSFNITDFIGGLNFVNAIFIDIWDGLGSWRMIITIPIFMSLALTFIGRSARISVQNSRINALRTDAGARARHEKVRLRDRIRRR